MPIYMNQFSFSDQLTIRLLSPADQAEILNCETVEMAVRLLSQKQTSVRLPAGPYQPKLQVSGSSVKYKTKKLFTESFDEQDVKDFMNLSELSSVMEDEIIAGELKRKMDSMLKEGNQPLQCLVYATKHNEKVFYNNEKKVAVWAKTIATFVNSNAESVKSINHMIVNWGSWKRQIMLLITACGYIKIKDNEKLDEVIRDLYLDYDDDKVKFTVAKRLLHGLNKDNYQGVFHILKNVDFVASDTDRKYFNVLKRKIEMATEEEREALYTVFKGIQGFSNNKRRKIESLFGEKAENALAEKINKSKPEQKEEILEEVYYMVFGSQGACRKVAQQARDIRLYRNEIQKMFMDKLANVNASIDEIKFWGMAIGDLDSDERAIPFLEEQMSRQKDNTKRAVFAYVLSTLSDSHVQTFIDVILKHGVSNSLWNYVRTTRSAKYQITRHWLYSMCVQIKDEHGENSEEFRLALKNISAYLDGAHASAVYDIKFDQLLFEYIGYDKINGIVDASLCSEQNAKLVLGIFSKIMNKSNYEGRYMDFMGALFNYLKDSNPPLAKKIETDVKKLTGQGIPSM